MSKDLTVYVVAVNRTDRSEPVWVIETNSKNEAIEYHQELTKEWTEAAAEKRPFVLAAPKVTSFLPALIFEIEVLELTPHEYQAMKTELPPDIKRNGLTGFMNNRGWGNP